MDIRQALKEQYHGGLAMLAECVEKCPDDIWVAGAHPRAFWRIVSHTVFFAHFYMVQDEAAFHESASGWPIAVRSMLGLNDTEAAIDIEPYDLPESARPLTRPEAADYIDYVRRLIDPTVDSLDLDRQDTGFSWYRNMTKLSHEIMSLRHIQGHVGQLSELLMARGIDTDWIARSVGPHK